MDDATQKLVDEARRQARILIRTGHGVEGRTLYERLADALEAAQRPLVEHPAHSGHEFGGAYARAAALAAGDPDWMNATGGQRPPVVPEVREIASGVLGQPQPRDYCVHCAGPCEHPDSSGEAR